MLIDGWGVFEFTTFPDENKMLYDVGNFLTRVIFNTLLTRMGLRQHVELTP